MIGKHLLADFYGVASETLNDTSLLNECLIQAAGCCGLTPLGVPRLHPFEGGGVTGFLLLAESHIALHTYPEHNFMTLDILSCGKAEPKAALAIFENALNPTSVETTQVSRGGQVLL